MAKSGLTHIDVGSELTRTEWESEESHALINGTAFPGSPTERQLFYRNDLHEWYIYNGSAWVSLQGAGGGGGDMLKSVYDTNDNAIVDNSEALEGSTKAQVQDHTPKAHTLASHSTKAHSELTGVGTDDHHPQVHGNADHSPDFAADADLDAHIADEAAPVHGSASLATANKLVHRDAAGRAKVVAPAASDDIAQKAQPDAVQTNLDSHAALTTAHSATPSPIPSRMVVRDGGARARFAAPAVSGDALIKGTAITDTEHGSRGSGLHADSHAKQHAITSTPDHTSGATPGQILKADANGLPVDATNPDADVADAVTKKHTQNTDTDLSPAHKDVATGVHGVGGSTVESIAGSQAKVDAHKVLTTGVHGAGGNTLWHGGLTNIVDKTHLSQDFGASSARLNNLILTPVQGEALRVQPATAPSVFSGLINGAPTATSVVYDGESNEGMLGGIGSGADRWGRPILHNTTRGNSRKIVEWDLGTNTITTESSTDDWADNDVITCQSQTNTQAGYFDLDLSNEISSTTNAAVFFVTLDDNEGNYDANRFVIFHPFEAYDGGKRQYLHSRLSNQANSLTFPMNIVGQKITLMFGSGVVDITMLLGVKGEFEYADT